MINNIQTTEYTIEDVLHIAEELRLMTKESVNRWRKLEVDAEVALMQWEINHAQWMKKGDF